MEFASFITQLVFRFLAVQERRGMECHVEGEVGLTRSLKTGKITDDLKKNKRE